MNLAAGYITGAADPALAADWRAADMNEPPHNRLKRWLTFMGPGGRGAASSTAYVHWLKVWRLPIMLCVIVYVCPE